MVVYQDLIKAYKEIISPAELNDPIINGKDVEFLKKLQTTIDYQIEIAKRLKMSVKEIKVDEIDFSVAGINSIIQTINENFYEIEQRINDIAAESGVIDFNTSKQTLLYFGDHNKTINLEINNDAIIIKTENEIYEYSVSDNIIRQV